MKKEKCDKVSINELFSVLHIRDGKEIGFTESVRQGRTSSAHLNNDRTISYNTIGPSPEGEEDTLIACRILINRLNQNGEEWVTLKAINKDGIDCIATGPRGILNIQVVRAMIDQKAWHKLGKENKLLKKQIPIEQLANQLKEAINKKASIADRETILLALDANRLPGFTFEIVLQEFLRKHKKWLMYLNFNAVWIIGPTEELTKPLFQQMT